MGSLVQALFFFGGSVITRKSLETEFWRGYDDTETVTIWLILKRFYHIGGCLLHI
jgi:hypothetical protein